MLSRSRDRPGGLRDGLRRARGRCLRPARHRLRPQAGARGAAGRGGPPGRVDGAAGRAPHRRRDHPRRAGRRDPVRPPLARSATSRPRATTPGCTPPTGSTWCASRWRARRAWADAGSSGSTAAPWSRSKYIDELRSDVGPLLGPVVGAELPVSRRHARDAAGPARPPGMAPASRDRGRTQRRPGHQPADGARPGAGPARPAPARSTSRPGSARSTRVAAALAAPAAPARAGARACCWAACRCSSPRARRPHGRRARRAAAVAAARRRGLPVLAAARLAGTSGGPSATSASSPSSSSGPTTDRELGVAASLAVALVAVATLVIGAFGLRLSRTTSDFYVASRIGRPVERLGDRRRVPLGCVLPRRRRPGPGATAWTCSGTRSATPPATSLLLVLVAAPLRRSGAYTLPDFAEGRLESRRVRPRRQRAGRACIGWLYLVPQFQGAGLTLRAVTGAPTWLGASSSRRSCWSRGLRRHARDHVRPGLPVLAQAHRAAGARCCPPAGRGGGDGATSSPGPHAPDWVQPLHGAARDSSRRTR